MSRGGKREGAGAKPAAFCSGCGRPRDWEHSGARCGECLRLAGRVYRRTGRGVEGFVYFIGHPSMEWPIKIGLARDGALERRVRQIQASSPISVELLAATFSENCSTLEKDLHARFAGDRLHGEWFAPSPALAELVRDVASRRRDGRSRSGSKYDDLEPRIRAMRSLGYGYKRIAKELGVSRDTARDLVRRAESLS